MPNTGDAINSVSQSPVDRMGFNAVNAVVIALLLWVGSTLNKSQIEVASLKVEISQLRVEMNRALDADSNQRQRLVKVENELANIKARMSVNK